MKPATIFETTGASPQLEEEDGSPTWIVRGASFVIVITEARRGTRIMRAGQADESMLYVPPSGAVDVWAQGERVTALADSLTILPPGTSEIVSRTDGYLFRFFTTQASDLAAKSANAAAYADVPLPERHDAAPPSGYRLRTYPLHDVVSGDAFGRIYRSTNLMVNVFEPFASARDPSALSPHSHDDFEQASLTIDGRFEHYLRTPWGKDRSTWREDRVVDCESPSVTVIPCTMIHTTAWREGGRMIDIFSPPRTDFARKPGWVRNEAEYPS